jgi:hypothetical protein
LEISPRRYLSITNSNLWIGRDQSLFFYGIINEVILFNKTLSSTDIEKLYNNGEIAQYKMSRFIWMKIIILLLLTEILIGARKIAFGGYIPKKV